MRNRRNKDHGIRKVTYTPYLRHEGVENTGVLFVLSNGRDILQEQTMETDEGSGPCAGRLPVPDL